MSFVNQRCGECHKFIWNDNPHTCQPRWQVYEEGRHAGWHEARIVHAENARDAAELYAQLYDDGGDYDIVSGHSTPTVHVRREGDEKETIFIVEGESVPQYRARLKVGS